MKRERLPPWIKSESPLRQEAQEIRGLLSKLKLHTVCEEARCPNLGTCFKHKTATFLILGDMCTRNCRFCAVEHGLPEPIDPREAARVAEAVATLNLNYCVLTSVTRDDLLDGGAGQFAEVVKAIKDLNPQAKVEVLVPDFGGCKESLGIVFHSSPDVFAHNLETVPRLYPTVRPRANYYRSLNILKEASLVLPKSIIKSGIMVGLGERVEELQSLFSDLVATGCQMLTIGQYLQPKPYLHPVLHYYSPEEFSQLREIALTMGFKEVVSGPFVRSSYRAEEGYKKIVG